MFSARNRLGHPRVVSLDERNSCEFALHGDSPVMITNLDEKAKVSILLFTIAVHSSVFKCPT